MPKPVTDDDRGRLCERAYEAYRDGDHGLEDMPGLIRALIMARAWESRQIRTGEVVKLENLRELIESAPLRGWGEKIDKVQKLIEHDAEVLKDWRRAITPKKGNPTGSNQHKKQRGNNDNIIIKKSEQGTAKAYTLDRLEREAPKLYAKVVDGKLSANAAAVKAGFRERTITINADDATSAARSIAKNCTRKFASELKDLL